MYLLLLLPEAVRLVTVRVLTALYFLVLMKTSLMPLPSYRDMLSLLP